MAVPARHCYPRILWIFVMCLSLFSPCVAYPTGVNIPAFACSSLTPEHQSTKQTTPPPYKISFDAESYTPNTPVSVTIESCNPNLPFKGFLIVATSASLGSSLQNRLGSFTAVSGTNVPLSCSDALSHVNADPKTSKTFQWTPPPTAQGHVVFRATFVQQKVTYWEDVVSEVLLDASITANLDPATVMPATSLSALCPSVPDVLQNGNFKKDTACNDTKLCFSDCTDSDGCTFLISMVDAGDYGQYTVSTKALTGSAPMYAAIGFSDDTQMGNDSVTGCHNTGGTMTVFNAYNSVYPPSQLLASDGVQLAFSSNVDGIFSCTFMRLKAAGLDGKRFNLNDQWHVLFAKSTWNSGAPQQHSSTNRQASTLKYNLEGTAQAPATQPPSGTTSNPALAGQAESQSGCGTNKGCFSDCVGTLCGYVLSWQQDGTYGVYTISSVVPSASAWVAFGLSADTTMGNDDVTGCVPDSNGNIVLVNGHTSGQAAPSQVADSEITLVNGKMNDNVLTCTIRRLISGSTQPQRYDISQSWNLLLARGNVGYSQDGSTYALQYHGTTNRFLTSSKVTISSLVNIGATKIKKPMIKAHGCLMIGAWVFFASIGIVAARYFKPVWKNDLCSQKVWFQIHRTCMVLVFGTTVAGFVIIFVEHKAWSELEAEKQYLRAHPYMGTVVTGLTVLNPIMALFRPHPGTSKRPIFNWLHWFVGTAAHILAVITIFFGLRLGSADAPDYLIYVLAGYVGWQVLIELTLETVQCSGRMKNDPSNYEMSDIGDEAKPQKRQNSESSSSITIKRFLFVLHLFVVSSLTAVLIGLLAVGKAELDD